MSKTQEKEKAIELRKQGLSYNEILKEVPAAKSTLSLWLRSVGLSIPQKQRLTEKKIASALRGAHAKKRKRIESEAKIKAEAINEVGPISERELWLISVALYWAEGAKEKEINGKLRGSRVKLSNSDPFLIKTFLKWLLDIYKVPRAKITFRIFLHETARHKLDEVRRHWSEITGFPLGCFQSVSWKKNIIKTKRMNVGENYFGLINIEVCESTNFNRKIAGWIQGIHRKL